MAQLPKLSPCWVVVTILCASILAADAAPMRIRKELRRLNATEKEAFVRGVYVMIRVPTEEGQKLYGPNYREYDYFVVKHAVTVSDPRGDQGHFGPCFITFHRALSIEFENALLSVVPELGAMPYWNLLLDVRGGAYAYPHPQSMFSPNWAGAINTRAVNGYSPKDGLFNDRQVPWFDSWKYRSVASVFHGSDSTGLLRGKYTPTTNRNVVRYPMTITDSPCYYADTKPGEFGMNYRLRDWQLCLDPKKFKTMMDWHWCIDFNGYEKSNAVTPGIDKLILPTCSSTLHAGPHLMIGGQAFDGTPGDFMDIATAPNEVLLFMTHHANLDRSFMIWQAAAAKNDPKQATKGVLWKYPLYPNNFRTMKFPYVQGCYLHDTIANRMPFTNIFPGQPSGNPDGYTHGDVLWYTRPGFANYTYDNMGTGI